jgi:hypothetical protein
MVQKNNATALPVVISIPIKNEMKEKSLFKKWQLSFKAYLFGKFRSSECIPLFMHPILLVLGCSLFCIAAVTLFIQGGYLGAFGLDSQYAIIKPLTDKNLYNVVRLPNGLEALLIQDPDTKTVNDLKKLAIYLISLGECIFICWCW